jgi:hypothetical protein
MQLKVSATKIPTNDTPLARTTVKIPPPQERFAVIAAQWTDWLPAPAT